MNKQIMVKGFSLVVIVAFVLSSCGPTGNMTGGNGTATEPVGEATIPPQVSEEPTENPTGTSELTADEVYPVAFASYEMPSYELPAAFS